MKKRFLSLMLAAALLLLLAACAASPKTPVPESSTPQESGLPSVATEPTEPAPDYDAQLRLLADAHAQWVKTDPMGNYSYCVADLDQNGRLEVLPDGYLGGQRSAGRCEAVRCFRSFGGQSA